MNFEEFKRRYHQKLKDVGAVEFPHDDRLGEIYIGLVVFNDWQLEELKKAQEQQKEALRKEVEALKNKELH